MGFESFQMKFSAISVNSVSYRAKGSRSTKEWLAAKCRDDNAEGLWRVHDKIYDLINFIPRHPGGEDWLRLTQGTDITELFETHHLSEMAEVLLQNFYIKRADKPRNHKLTFEENGFYKQLKLKAADQLVILKKRKDLSAGIIHSSLLLSTIILLLFASLLGSVFVSVIAGVSLAFLGTVCHNFLHTRDNWRMFCFNLTGFNYREWRVSHVMSHHMFTNTAHDLEIANWEPMLRYIPQYKTELFKVISIIAAPVAWLITVNVTILKRTIGYFNGSHDFQTDQLITFLPPAMMYFIGQRDVVLVIKLWVVMISVSGFVIGFIQATSGHHHPKNYHEGDELPPSMDFAIFQMNSVITRSDIKAKKFQSLTQFGHNTLHHMFPMLDNTLLPHFYELFLDTCREFEFQLRECSWWPLIVGHFNQLQRTKSISLKEMKLK